MHKIDQLIIECPNCNHHFDHEETFSWGIDDNGHPTVEFLSCPKCYVATEPIFSCGICPGQHKCKLKEECGACLYYSHDEWKEVKNKNS